MKSSGYVPDHLGKAQNEYNREAGQHQAEDADADYPYDTIFGRRCVHPASDRRENGKIA